MCCLLAGSALLIVPVCIAIHGDDQLPLTWIAMCRLTPHMPSSQGLCGIILVLGRFGSVWGIGGAKELSTLLTC